MHWFEGWAHPRGDWTAVRRLEQLRLLERMAARKGTALKSIQSELNATIRELLVALSGDAPRVRWAASICLERAVEGSDDPLP